MEENLKKWQEAVEGATPGPWFEDDDGGVSTEPQAHTATSWPIVDTEGCGMGNPGNAVFIAVARTAMPRLLAAVEVMRGMHRRNRTEDGLCQGYTADGGYGYIHDWCVECSEKSGLEYGTEWPCATIQALEEHLGGGDR